MLVAHKPSSTFCNLTLPISLRILDVTEIKSIPYARISHSFIKRVTGTIRCEYLDQTPFWNSRDVARRLDDVKD